jgi:hypothetical protein
MGSKYVNAYIETTKTRDQLKADVLQMLRSLGGTLYSVPNGYRLVGGTYGTQMSFTSTLTADAIVQPIKENKYEVQIFLSWTWSSIMSVILIFGILGGGLPWLFLILYLFFDPAPAYQQALYRLVNFENL